jgi:hypothetical protein
MKLPFKVTVCFEERPGGGLRAWSDDVPGLVLSHSDVDAVLADVGKALGVLLSERHAGRGQDLPVKLRPNTFSGNHTFDSHD